MSKTTKEPDTAEEAVAAADEALHDVATLLPTVGRIVHLKINDDEAGEVLRPALVLGRGDIDTFLHLQVFLYPHDVPYAPGTRIRKFDAVPGAFFARAPEGDSVGDWRWPSIGGDLETEDDATD